MSDTLRKIAVIGGSRIPFCRSNSIYSEKTNLDMLAAALQVVVNRFSLDGKQLDEVVAGAVTTHSKDWNLAREALLTTALSPLTPGITLQQACGTSLQSALMIGAKIASGRPPVLATVVIDSPSICTMRPSCSPLYKCPSGDGITASGPSSSGEVIMAARCNRLLGVKTPTNPSL